MRTNFSSTGLIMGLVFAIAVGAGCADKDKKKGGGGSVTPATSKVMDVTTTVKSGPTEVAFTFTSAMFVKDAAVAAKIMSWQAEQDGNMTKRVKLENAADGKKLTLTATDADHETRLVAIGADDKVVTESGNEVVADFSGWDQTEGSYPVDLTKGAFRWFLYKAHVVPSPMKVTVTKKSAGGWEQTISILADYFPEVRAPGQGKWNWEINKLSTARSEASDAKDGWRSVTVTLAQLENSSIRAVFVDGGNVVQQDNKDLVLDLSVWSKHSYTVNVSDGTILVRADRGDLCKWGTREVPGRPGIDGYGPNRFGIELVNNVPAFHAYVRLSSLTEQEQKDKDRILFGADWDKFPARVNAVPYCPGWFEPAGVMGKVTWDKVAEYEVVVADTTGTRIRTFEFPEESEYLRPGSRTAIQFVASGKAFIAPASWLDTGSAFQGFEFGQYPFVSLRMPGLGAGETHFRVLGKFTTAKGDFRADVTLYPELTWTEFTRDNQGNIVPVQAGSEKTTVTRTTTDLIAKSKPNVGLASGEIQGKVTFLPPATGNTPPPITREGSYWVVP